MMCFLLVLGMVFGMLGAIGFLPDTAKSAASARSVFEIVDARSHIDRNDHDAGPPGLLKLHTADIAFRNVAFSYPSRSDHQIFANLELTIAAGKQTAIIGRTGCGKSTIIGLLQRFYAPTSGHIELGGQRLDEISVTWLRSQMGSLAQEPCLFSDTIENNVKLGRADATHAEVEEACRCTRPLAIPFSCWAVSSYR